jgi:hypothetical protein
LKTTYYKGLELEFDLDITPDEEVILDRDSGHGMKGKGYGSLLFKINTLGKFNMWGDFQHMKELTTLNMVNRRTKTHKRH